MWTGIGAAAALASLALWAHPGHAYGPRSPETPSRRALLRQALAATAAGLSSSSLLAPGRSALALSPPQKPLEQLRIQQQLEADAVLGGELADPTGRKTLPTSLALLGVVKISLLLDRVAEDLRAANKGNAVEALEGVRRVLELPELETKAVKRSFNQYSDNIYFTLDSERQNQYLGGGAVPTGMQTNQYLLRNQFLGHLQDLRSEVDYWLGSGAKEEGGIDIADAEAYCESARDDMKEYLKLAQAEDVERALPAARASISKLIVIIQ